MMLIRWSWTFALFLALTPASPAQNPKLATDLEILVAKDSSSEARRAAWMRVASAGPDALPAVLEAMNARNTPTSNWLRTAFDRIADRARAKNTLPVDKLLAFAKDASNSGKARRLALDVVEQVRPGTSEQLFARSYDDPEFRFEGVTRLLDKAQTLAKAGSKKEAIAAFRTALASSRDVSQSREAATGLLDFGIEESVAQHYGFLTDWYLIGPFDAKGKKGFTISYPPEKNVDLTQKLEGKTGPVAWTRHHAREASPRSNTKHQVLIDLRKAVADMGDVLAYAYTEIEVPTARKVEFRGAADDNFTVWVNGNRVFGFEEYDNGVRFDRHRFPVALKAGKNSILVKIVQAVPPNPGPNWEFFLRIADDTGKGIAMKNLLPPPKSTSK